MELPEDRPEDGQRRGRMPLVDLSYGGISASSMGILIARRPDIPVPEDDIEEIEIPGRDGAMHISRERKKSVEIKVEMGFREKENWAGSAGKIKEWLDAKGEKLIFSDDLDCFYHVYYVKPGDLERITRRLGTFEVVFVCYPYRYLAEGENWTEEKLFYNRGAPAHPVYFITGEGMCTLTVNGKTLTANVGQNITIDTERMIAYREDGAIMNTSVTGDYENAYLLHGKNEVSISKGFSLKLQPRWRCL